MEIQSEADISEPTITLHEARRRELISRIGLHEHGLAALSTQELNPADMLGIQVVQ